MLMIGIIGFANLDIMPYLRKYTDVLDENNMRNGKYWHVTKLAAKCTAKRLYPRPSTKNWGIKTA